MNFQKNEFCTQFNTNQNVSRRGVFNTHRRNCSRRRQLCSSSGAYYRLIEHIILAQSPNPISSEKYVPQHSIPVYPTRSGVLCTGICILPESKNIYGHLIISTFRWVVPEANSVRSHIRRLHGNRKHGQNKTARPGRLWQHVLGLPSSTYKGYTESQTLRSVSATLRPSYSRRPCSCQHNILVEFIRDAVNTTQTSYQ